MIKLTELIKEECSCDEDCCSAKLNENMEMGKVFTGGGFAFKKEEFKNESLYNVSQDMKDGKFDPKNPQVVIQGYGVTNLKTLQDSLSRKFTDLAKKAKKGDVENIEYILKRNGVLMGFVDALVNANKELSSSTMKRKITMYKRKR